MTRNFCLLLLAVLLLPACVPSLPPPASTPPVTKPSPVPDDRPTQNPALIPFYTKNIPEAVLIAGDRQQTSRSGSSSWIVEKTGNQLVQEHGDALGFASSTEPLPVDSPFTVTLRLPVPVKPYGLEYWIIPAPEKPWHISSDGYWAVWNTEYQIAKPLPREVEQEIHLPTAPGRYLMGVNVTWEDLGSVDYGFYLEVQAAPSGLAISKPTVSESCTSIEHLANDSPEGQLILDEMIANFKRQQPTEHMGMAILNRIDLLGDWAVIQGSVSSEGKDVIVVLRTPQGWQIAERYIITAPLASFDHPEVIVPDYFLVKLPQAPPALFTCLDQSWLLEVRYATPPAAAIIGESIRP